MMVKKKTNSSSVLKLLLGCGLILSLNGCFIIPRFKIRKALQKKDCTSLSQNFIYDLPIKEIKKGVEICLEKSQFQETLTLLAHLEKQNISLEERQEVIKKRGLIYLDKLFLYKKSIKEFQNFLTKEPRNLQVRTLLINAYIKQGSLKEALKEIEKISSKDLTSKQRLEFSLTQARLLLFLGKKEKSFSIFQQIKTRDMEFFEKHHGPFYVALILEEEHKFLEAMEELKKTDWPFIEEKKIYWENREKNLPK